MPYPLQAIRRPTPPNNHAEMPAVHTRKLRPPLRRKSMRSNRAIRNYPPHSLDSSPRNSHTFRRHREKHGHMKRTSYLIATTILVSAALCGCTSIREQTAEGIAVLSPTQGSIAQGTIYFGRAMDGVRV